MFYYARFGHMKELPHYKVGDKIERGNIVGIMGSTGKSTGPHVHLDLIQKEPNGMYRMADVPNYITDLDGLMRQYKYFVDNELFDCKIVITTYFGDPDYLEPWEFHPGYDVIPAETNKKNIYWNRSQTGTVFMIGTDIGYGNYIVIRYMT
jgi:murein DD-endopeptidase MepM/ murein hydrolase activator NlpD